MLLQIRPGLARAWRAPGRLQIGLDPACGVVLDGLTAADEHVLAALGTGTYDRGRLHAQASRWELDHARVDDLVRVLDDAGVLLPAVVPSPVLAGLDDLARSRLAATARRLAVAAPESDGWEAVARRLRARVVVQGGCRVGLRVAATLAASGIGAVLVHDDSPVLGSDVGPGRLPARGRRPPARPGGGRAALPGPGPAVAPGPPRDRAARRRRPGRRRRARPGGYDPWLALDVPHLAVVVREAGAAVGPTVRAGQGCCLRCVELYRTDRDPQWPRVAAQLATGWTGPCDPAVAEHTAALAVCEVLTVVDGRGEPVTAGRTLEIGPGRPVPVVRCWPVHARCGCVALPGVADSGAERPASPGATAGGAASMMGG